MSGLATYVSVAAVAAATAAEASGTEEGVLEARRHFPFSAIPFIVFLDKRLTVIAIVFLKPLKPLKQTEGDRSDGGNIHSKVS